MRRLALAPYLLSLVLPLVALFLASPTQAEIDDVLVEDLTLAAHAVVVGGVILSESDYNQERTTIITTATVAISLVVTGSVSGAEAIRVSREGGTVGSTSIETEAAAVLDVGDTVVLFLAASGSEWEVLAGPEGVFTVVGGIVQETGETLSEFITRIQGGS